MKFSTMVVAVLFFALGAQASFLPDKDLSKIRIPVQSVHANSLSESDFNQVIAKMTKIYQPEVQKFGGKLSIRGDWRSEKLNAGATQLFGNWNVVITGGLARHQDLTKDGLTLILCHEMGHHLSGFAFAPAQNPLVGTWAANEGQADYFAVQSCARRFWSDEMDTNKSFETKTPENFKSECQRVWTGTDSLNICYRTLVAVESMIRTMATIKNVPMPTYWTPDPKQVDQTDSNHPEPQCRMDTSLQGALCTAQFDPTVIPGKNASGGVFSEAAERESSKYTCMQSSGFNLGLRPACWFKARL